MWLEKLEVFCFVLLGVSIISVLMFCFESTSDLNGKYSSSEVQHKIIRVFVWGCIAAVSVIGTAITAHLVERR